MIKYTLIDKSIVYDEQHYWDQDHLLRPAPREAMENGIFYSALWDIKRPLPIDKVDHILKSHTGENGLPIMAPNDQRRASHDNTTSFIHFYKRRYGKIPKINFKSYLHPRDQFYLLSLKYSKFFIIGLLPFLLFSTMPWIKFRIDLKGAAWEIQKYVAGGLWCFHLIQLGKLRIRFGPSMDGKLLNLVRLHDLGSETARDLVFIFYDLFYGENWESDFKTRYFQNKHHPLVGL